MFRDYVDRKSARQEWNIQGGEHVENVVRYDVFTDALAGTTVTTMAAVYYNNKVCTERNIIMTADSYTFEKQIVEKSRKINDETECRAVVPLRYFRQTTRFVNI